MRTKTNYFVNITQTQYVLLFKKIQNILAISLFKIRKRQLIIAIFLLLFLFSLPARSYDCFTIDTAIASTNIPINENTSYETYSLYFGIEVNCSSSLDYNTQKERNSYIDLTIQEVSTLYPFLYPHNSNIFHLISHGKSGKLFLEGQWRNAKQIAQWLKENHFIDEDSHLNIYGCEFAKGERGKAAVQYLETTLGITVAASDDLTGIDGDWELEIGNAKEGLKIPNYPYNLQTPVSILSP